MHFLLFSSTKDKRQDIVLQPGVSCQNKAVPLQRNRERDTRLLSGTRSARRTCRIKYSDQARTWA